jgi:hypothetical protein
MEEYNKHIERLKKINAITGDSEIAIITRGINDIVNSRNICESMQILYCNYGILSMSIRSIIELIISKIEDDIKKHKR